MRNLLRLFFILSLMSTPALGATLFVPDQYPTIQEAVDAAEPHDLIMVGPGEYAGAVIDRAPVIIEGSGQDTRIVAANDYFLWPGEDALDIFGQDAWPGFCPNSECGADGTQIRNLTIEPGEGAFFWGIAFFGADDVQLEDITIMSTPWSVQGNESDRASVRDLKIVDSYQGIASWDGNLWTIEDNMLIGVEKYPWQGGMQSDMILIAGRGNGHLIEDNTIYHLGDAACTGEQGSNCGPGDDERYAGVALVAWSGAMGDNVVKDNRVTILVEGDGIDGQSAIVLVDYSYMSGGPALIQGNSVVDNVLDAESGLDLVPSELSELNLVYDNK
jgi:hypothetical protein